MKRLGLILSFAVLASACSKQCNDGSCAAPVPEKPVAAQKASVPNAVPQKVEAKAAQAVKAVEKKAAQAVSAIEELAKDYVKVNGKKMGVLAVAVEQQSIVLSLGSNDGFKEDQRILLFKNGKPAAEVSVTELYPEQINATFSEGSDPKLFNSGDSLDFGILQEDVK